MVRSYILSLLRLSFFEARLTKTYHVKIISKQIYGKEKITTIHSRDPIPDFSTFYQSAMESMDEDDDGMDSNDFILSHVVLPRYLPPLNSDYSEQLNLLNELLRNVFDAPIIPMRTLALFKQFKKIHIDSTPDTLKTALSIQLGSLLSGDTFAMFVRGQNTTLIIHKSDLSDDMILATFPGDVDANKVYELDSDIEVI